MSVAIVTGSAGLVGSEASEHFAGMGLEIAGIDNDLRSTFFGAEASTASNLARLQATLGSTYQHHAVDIRDRPAISALFKRFGGAVSLVLHCAAQPSHDWAARDPIVDFEVNALGTLNLLEATRQFAPEAVFISMSTNKVYGDRPNDLPFVELDTRWELEGSHPWSEGITEEMSIDRTLHSLFGASKVAGDILVQEYGRYFGLGAACFRGGTLTGSRHAATELHGFLAYVMRCTMSGTPYRVFGYKGKQVRDAIHSSDLVRAFDAFFRDPRPGEVYNIGGGRFSNASVLEAITLSEEIGGRALEWAYVDEPRRGDHMWWIGSNARFEGQFPNWKLEYDVPRILEEIYEHRRDEWTA